MRQLGRLVGVFKKDGWFSIGIGNRLTATLAGREYDLLRWKVLTHDAFNLSRHLGNVSILAKKTAKIAAHSRYGVGPASGVKVEQWFFLHRIHMPGDCASVNQALQPPALIFTYAADSPLLVFDHTAVRTEMALNSLFFQLLI